MRTMRTSLTLENSGDDRGWTPSGLRPTTLTLRRRFSRRSQSETGRSDSTVVRGPNLVASWVSLRSTEERCRPLGVS